MPKFFLSNFIDHTIDLLIEAFEVFYDAFLQMRQNEKKVSEIFFL